MSLNLRVPLRPFLFCHAFCFWFWFFVFCFSCPDLKLTWFRTLFWISVTAAPLLAMGLGWHAYTRRVITWFVCFFEAKRKKRQTCRSLFPDIEPRLFPCTWYFSYRTYSSPVCVFLSICCYEWLWIMTMIMMCDDNMESDWLNNILKPCSILGLI